MFQKLTDSLAVSFVIGLGLIFGAALGVPAPAWSQALTDLLAIDANEDELTATLTYRGASVDVFGHVREALIKGETEGRLAITVIGPQVPQSLRIVGRNALGMVTNGPASNFEHLPGFWSLHATPPAQQLLDMTSGQFDRLPHQLQSWAFEQSQIDKADNDLGGNALQAQVNEGRLSVSNEIRLRPSGLFNTTLELPAFAPVGRYTIQAHWLDGNDRHVASQQKTLVVARGPIAQWIATTASTRGLMYGLICVLVAILGGLVSEVVFRRLAP